MIENKIELILCEKALFLGNFCLGNNGDPELVLFLHVCESLNQKAWEERNWLKNLSSHEVAGCRICRWPLSVLTGGTGEDSRWEEGLTVHPARPAMASGGTWTNWHTPSVTLPLRLKVKAVDRAGVQLSGKCSTQKVLHTQQWAEVKILGWSAEAGLWAQTSLLAEPCPGRALGAIDSSGGWAGPVLQLYASGFHGWCGVLHVASPWIPHKTMC